MTCLSSQPIHRRTFLQLSTGAILSTLFPFVPASASCPDQKVLSFYNIHTEESLDTCYRVNGRLVNRAVDRISHIMRDYRTGEVKSIDPQLLDLLHRLVTRITPSAPISIISGYRSPRTNAVLRKTTTGVSENSLHMQGRAIDIRIPGCRTTDIRELAIALKSGGVGYYPDSNFVHLDTGPIKVW